MLRALLRSLLAPSEPARPVEVRTRLSLNPLEARENPSTLFLGSAGFTDASYDDVPYAAAGVSTSRPPAAVANRSGSRVTQPVRPPVVAPTRPPAVPTYNPWASARGAVVDVDEVRTASTRIVVKTVSISGATGNNLRLFADFLDRTGRVVRPDMAIGDHKKFGNQDQPSVAALSNGNFAIAWRASTPLTGSSSSIQYALTNQTGTLVGFVERRANVIPSQRLSNPQVTADGSGFRIAWANASTGRTDVRGFNTVGVPIW